MSGLAGMSARILTGSSCPKGVANCHDAAGPGVFLRSFVVIAVVLLVVGAWFILRGYRGDDKK
jgi:hypothetical protein